MRVPAGAAGSPLAVTVCYQQAPAGWAPALGGPPTIIHIHIIMSEGYGPDPLYGSWILTPGTVSVTVILGLHTLIGLQVATAPYIPAGCTIQYICGLNPNGQFVQLGMDFLLGALIVAHNGPSMIDFQLELGPLVEAVGPAGPAVTPLVPPGGDGGVVGYLASRGSSSHGRAGSRGRAGEEGHAGASRGRASSGHAGAPRGSTADARDISATIVDGVLAPESHRSSRSRSSHNLFLALVSWLSGVPHGRKWGKGM